MGMFPYECVICGGGEIRCGSDNCDDDCDGGQFCWESDVVITFTFEEQEAEEKLELTSDSENEGIYKIRRVVQPKKVIVKSLQGVYDGYGSIEFDIDGEEYLYDLNCPDDEEDFIEECWGITSDKYSWGVPIVRCKSCFDKQ
jgi:hypothetical protein